MAQRISLAQEQLKLATSKPEMHNLYEAYRRVYISLGVDNVEQLLPPPPQPQPMNAVIENGKVAVGYRWTNAIKSIQNKTMMHIYVHT